MRTHVTTACAIAIGSFQIAAGLAATPKAGVQSAPIDACALLKESEISAAIQKPVGAGERGDSGAQPDGSYSSTCIWTVRLDTPADENPLAPFGGKSFVILNVIQWPAGSALAHSFLDSFYAASQRGEIPGKPSPRKFGDDALWWGDGLAIVRGDVAFGVSAFLPSSPPSRPGVREEQLAPHILARLEMIAGNRVSAVR